ncbi:unnamed protein product, partial [Symbiodinium sp. CCMP2456]
QREQFKELLGQGRKNSEKLKAALQKMRGGGEPSSTGLSAAEPATAGPAATTDGCAPDENAEQYLRRSNVSWVRPLVPEMTDATVLCSLSTGKKEETQWVARHYGELPEAKTAEEKSAQKPYTQKTRTATLKSFSSSHAAFLAALDWLWKKHALVTGEQPPVSVVKILADTACHAGKTADHDKCDEAMKRLGASQPAPCPPPRPSPCPPPCPSPCPLPCPPAEAADAPPHDDVLSSLLEVQPSRKKRVSDSPAGSGREAPAKKKRIPDTPTREKWGMPAGLQSRLSGFLDVSARAEISSGPWNRVRICGDGNCLFTAAAVGHRALKSGTLEMDAVKQRQWGKTNRAVQMQWMEQHQGEPFPPGESNTVLLKDAIIASSGKQPDEYFAHMGSTAACNAWGGWLEAAVMAFRWKCQVKVYSLDGGTGRYRHLSTVGIVQNNGSIIRLLWLGDHYDLLVAA